MMRLLVALALVFWAAPSFAQFETATVVGTVRDSSGAVVPGAKVTLTNRDTGVSVERMSDSNGSFEFFTVRIGTYLISAEKEGFSIAVIDELQVTVGARQRVDLSMAVGQLSETVEVSARSVLLQTDSSERAQVITGDRRAPCRSTAANTPHWRCLPPEFGSRRWPSAVARDRSTSTGCAPPSTTS